MPDPRENVPDDLSLSNAGTINRGELSGALTQFADIDTIAVFEASHPRLYSVFGEGRERPIACTDGLPVAWLTALESHLARFDGVAQPGEYYVFQLGVWAGKQPLEGISLCFSEMEGETDSIPADKIHCFNMGGVDCLGQDFDKRVDAAQGTLVDLWCGIQVPRGARGYYTGRIMVMAENAAATDVNFHLQVKGDVLDDGGVGDAWRLTRLHWLDSRIGFDDQHVVKPFVPLKRNGRTISLLGRTLTIGDNGLPQDIASYFSSGNTRLVDAPLNLLAQPMRFEVEIDGTVESLVMGNLRFSKETPAIITWHVSAESSRVQLQLAGSVEFDGSVSCQIHLAARQQVRVTDIRLIVAHAGKASALFLGLGQGGRACPEALEWTWSGERHQDAYWIGAVHGGLQLRFKGGNYRKPNVNVYYEFRKLNIPDSWGNGGQGGLRLERQSAGETLVSVFSGKRVLQAGESLQYDIDMLITPFKLIDTDAYWCERYFHQGGMDNPLLEEPAQVAGRGASVLNVHHCSYPIPAINYPMWERSYPELKTCVKKAHAAGLRIKAYYTIREITSLMPEIFAFNSLDGEIIEHGDARKGTLTNPEGAHPWLLEHLGTDFIPAWRAEFKGKYAGIFDLAVITTPDSRLDNFWLEGLDFIARDADIDGIYIDDTSLGRKALQRARRILENSRPAPLIDMHMWRGTIEPEFGNVEPTTLFMENYPYYDRIWCGEHTHYEAFAPETWLLEVSGVPFGVKGEMLHRGGNPWLGMVYGITARCGWTEPDVRPIWELWDAFGMAGTEMIGYWDPACPVISNDPEVKVTVFYKPGAALLAIGNFANGERTITLAIDWTSLGFDAQGVRLCQPAVEGMQKDAQYSPDMPLTIPGKQGLLLQIGKR